jgi:hypothetical protein
MTGEIKITRTYLLELSKISGASIPDLAKKIGEDHKVHCTVDSARKLFKSAGIDMRKKRRSASFILAD